MAVAAKSNNTAQWADALKFMKAGQRKRGHAIYDMLWKVRPPQADPWFNAGFFSREDKLPERAVKFFQEACKRAPNDDRFRFNLALAHSDLKDWTAVMEALEGRCPYGHPQALDAANLRGVALRNLDRRPEAIEVLQELLAQSPNYSAGLRNMVNILADLSRYDDAIRWQRRERVLAGEAPFPSFREADFLFRATEIQKSRDHYIELIWGAERVCEQMLAAGKKFYSIGMYDDALVLWRLAALDDPANVAAFSNLGATLRTQKDYPASQKMFSHAVVLDEKNLSACNGMGNLMLDLQKHADAEKWFRKALDADPDFRLGKANLVRVYSETQDWDKAAAMAREVVDVEDMDQDQFVSVFTTLKKVCDFDTLGKHDFWSVVLESARKRNKFGSMLDSLSMADTPESIETLFEIHKLWAERLGQYAKREALPPPVWPARRARLRVGLLSGDLRGHVVGMFMRPIIKYYDRSKYELVALSTYPKAADKHMNTIKGQVDKFVDIGEKKAPEAAALIRDEEIDVLVELAGFTKFGNMGAVEWRPARRSVEYLGYPFTTGLAEMDFVFADRWTNPGTSGHLVEKVLESEGPYYCLTNREAHGGQGFGDDIIDPKPFATANGYVTFGTFNNPYKIIPAVVDAWARILHGVPNSRLSVVRYEEKNETITRNLKAAFEVRGIDPERIVIDVNPRGWHMFWYNRVDIALDTFPQTGGTTTCETIWMGVPVVTLVGTEIFGRLSYSTLMQGGFPELCCHTVDDYVRTAVELGLDHDRIVRYRVGMRDQIRSSPLCDEPAFARTWMEAMERAYEQD